MNFHSISSLDSFNFPFIAGILEDFNYCTSIIYLSVHPNELTILLISSVILLRFSGNADGIYPYRLMQTNGL